MKPDNGKRAASLRRYWVSPARVERVKAQVYARVCADMLAKTIAEEIGLSPGRVCDWIHKLGFRCMYVTAEERALIMRQRAERAGQGERKEAA